VLVTILSIQFRIINLAFEIDLHFRIVEMLSIAILVGIFYGASYGVLSNYLERKVFRGISLWKIILVKAFGSIVLLSLFALLLRFELLELFFPTTIGKLGTGLSDEAWRYIFFLFLSYYFFMALLI